MGEKLDDQAKFRSGKIRKVSCYSAQQVEVEDKNMTLSHDLNALKFYYAKWWYTTLMPYSSTSIYYHILSCIDSGVSGRFSLPQWWAAAKMVDNLKVKLTYIAIDLSTSSAAIASSNVLNWSSSLVDLNEIDSYSLRSWCSIQGSWEVELAFFYFAINGISVQKSGCMNQKKTKTKLNWTVVQFSMWLFMWPVFCSSVASISFWKISSNW